MLEGHNGSDIGAADVGAGVPLDNHSLLLSLAGLIDDELLGWSRELAAVGEFDYALDLITATVVAEDVRLPEPVHATLVAAQRGGSGMELPAPVKGSGTAGSEHRFLADPVAAGYPSALTGHSPVEALRGLPGRLLRGCRLWLSWRLTPTGTAPTPVPHPVLLVETADAAGADLLAYQVADLLGRSGAFVSVEVFGPDSVVGDYHRAAMDASTALEDLEFTGASLQLEAVRADAARSEPVTDAAPPLAVAPPPLNTPLPQRGPGRPPLEAVERVRAARASAPRNPIDNVMPFERGPADRPFPDRPLFDRSGPGQGADPLDRPFAAFDDGFGSGAHGAVPQRGRREDMPPPGASRPHDRSAPPRGPVGPPPFPTDGPVGPPQFPGASPQGPAGRPGMPPKGPITGAFPAPGPGAGPQQPQGPGPAGFGPGGPGPQGSGASPAPPAFPASPAASTGPNLAQPRQVAGPGQPGGPHPGQPARQMDRSGPPPRNGTGPDRGGVGPDRNGAGPDRSGPDRNGAGPERGGVERTAMMPERAPGPDRNGGSATRTVPPVRPPVSQQTARQSAPPPLSAAGPGPQGPGPQGPGPQGPGPHAPGPVPAAGPAGQQQPGQPQRPPLRPVDLPELPDGLSDVEQKLLRQLHEELAAREDGPSVAGQGPRGGYRNGSNGAGRPPRQPMGPDQAG